MPAAGTFQNNSALFRAVVPQQSFAQLSAMKDRELALTARQEERARLDQAENAQRIQQQQDFTNQIKNLPFEAPDKQRIKLWVNQKQRELAKHIEDRYPDKEGDYFKAESQMWMKNTLSELMNTDLYANAEMNKEQVFLAKQALKNQENLTGEFDEKGNYSPAEQKLLAYYEGKNPTFRFNGSYKPDAQFVYDHFGKQDNPYGSKYDRNAAAPERDVLNLITSKMGDKNGKDMFYRSFMGRTVPYKRYSLEDQQLFNLDVANKNSSMEARRQGTAQGWARLDLQRQKMENDKKESSQFDQGLEQVLGSPIGTTQPQPISANPSQILNSIGKPLSSLLNPNTLNKDAKRMQQLGVPMVNGTIEFTEYSGVTAGPLHDKYANLSLKTGKIKEGILSDGNKIDLENVPHAIQSVNPNIFVDQPESNRITEKGRQTGRTEFPDHEFRKAQVYIKKKDVDENKISVVGAKPYMSEATEDSPAEVEGYYFDIMVGTKGFFQNKEIQQLYNKGTFGQKRANDILDQGVDSFSSPIDNLVD